MTVVSVSIPNLHTTRLLLRAIADSDRDGLLRLHTNPRVMRYWDSPVWTDSSRAVSFLSATREMSDTGTGVRLAVERLTDSTFLGWCQISRINRSFRSAALGYCFDEAVWGHGYATESVSALVAWALNELDLNRIQAEVDTRNGPSARVLEKVGFVREGTLREDCIVNGEVSDSWVYGLLRREWDASATLGLP